jgi:hypothetical protein
MDEIIKDMHAQMPNEVPDDLVKDLRAYVKILNEKYKESCYVTWITFLEHKAEECTKCNGSVSCLRGIFAYERCG